VNSSFGSTKSTNWGIIPAKGRIAVMTGMLEIGKTNVRGAYGPQQTFHAAPDRERLTPAALTALRNLARAWKLTAAEASALVGGLSETTWDRIRTDVWKQTLSQDQMMRVSAMIGIFKGLHLLFADDMADRWVRLRNSGPLFSNLTPIEAMIERGIPGMIEIRQHVDALRGGL
jgi:hypothetical protein